MIIAETMRLLLRTLEVEDIDALMNFWGDEEVMKYCGGAGTREREERALAFYINLQNEREYSPYAVILKENGNFIGVCGFNPPYDHEYMELMYHFAKDYWGKGYATEAAKACLQYAIEHLRSDKIVAFIDPNNQGSENVLRKLGFTYKGLKWHGGSKKEEPYFEWKYTEGIIKK
ncbi:GNAT family N-acetyltransferase [Bacillus sp. HMF5848]|uniref:GNAT family N-acetyltransferase n=1 Tax=Bacillus sp. HMF5848 TaxID=2495421 RepID=UPI0021AD7F70|nr:GNAT family N-acetyltransferase [Bacillus sp. HMF5848]